MANTEKQVADSNKENRKNQRREARQQAWENCKEKWQNFRRELIKWIGVGLAIIGVFLFLVISCLVFNPAVVWLLLLIAPKSIMSLMYDGDEEIWDVWKIPFNYSKWLYHLVPWRCRKVFLDEGFYWGKASSQDRLRFFFKEDKQVFASLSTAEKNEVFSQKKYRSFCIERRMELTDEQFGQLDAKQMEAYANAHKGLTFTQFRALADIARNNEAVDALWRVISSFTPSYGQLTVLANREYLESTLIATIIQYGVNKNKVADLKRLIGNDERWSKVEKAMKYYTQIQIAKSDKYTIGDWRYLCEAESDICEWAQEYMTLKMYQVFHETNHCLCDEAIVFLLQNRDLNFACTLFGFEPENGLKSKEAKAIVEGDPQLKLTLLRVQECTSLQAQAKEMIEAQKSETK